MCNCSFCCHGIESRRGSVLRFVQLHYLCSEWGGHFPVIPLISAKHNTLQLTCDHGKFQRGRRVKTPSVSRLHNDTLSAALQKKKIKSLVFILVSVSDCNILFHSVIKPRLCYCSENVTSCGGNVYIIRFI